MPTRKELKPELWSELEFGACELGDVRAAQLTRKVRTADNGLVKLGELLKSAPSLGAYRVYVSANRKQIARWAQVEVIEYYELRPTVEEYHQCLKTGLQIEERQI